MPDKLSMKIVSSPEDIGIRQGLAEFPLHYKCKIKQQIPNYTLFVQTWHESHFLITTNENSIPIILLKLKRFAYRKVK